jgi:hypothetical protein
MVRGRAPVGRKCSHVHTCWPVSYSRRLWILTSPTFGCDLNLRGNALNKNRLLVSVLANVVSGYCFLARTVHLRSPVPSIPPLSHVPLGQSCWAWSCIATRKFTSDASLPDSKQSAFVCSSGLRRLLQNESRSRLSPRTPFNFSCQMLRDILRSSSNCLPSQSYLFVGTYPMQLLPP